jgi:hypothetical protein
MSLTLAAAAYFNLDSSVSGSNFGAAASPVSDAILSQQTGLADDTVPRLARPRGGRGDQHLRGPVSLGLGYQV